MYSIPAKGKLLVDLS